MLSVRISPMAIVQNNLEQYKRQIDNQIWEMEQVLSRLNGLSDMDGPIAGLRGQIANLEEADRYMDRMSRCLNQTIQNYNSCENRICDYAQQEAVVYARHRIGTNDLHNISDMLQMML